MTNVRPTRVARGWTLFFVVGSALFACHGFFLLFEAALLDIPPDPDPRDTILFVSIVYMFYAVLVYGLYCVFIVKKGAVSLIKILLVLDTVLTVTSPAIQTSIFVFFNDAGPVGEFIILMYKNMGIKNIALLGISIVWNIIWLVYFSCSQRVKELWNLGRQELPTAKEAPAKG